RTLPTQVGDPECLLKWKRPKHPTPTLEQCERWRQRTREVLARYFASIETTPLLTTTERERRIQKAKTNPEALRKLDINSRVIADRRERYGPQYGQRGPRWPDPLLADAVVELTGIW